MSDNESREYFLDLIKRGYEGLKKLDGLDVGIDLTSPPDHCPCEPMSKFIDLNEGDEDHCIHCVTACKPSEGQKVFVTSTSEGYRDVPAVFAVDQLNHSEHFYGETGRILNPTHWRPQ